MGINILGQTSVGGGVPNVESTFEVDSTIGATPGKMVQMLDNNKIADFPVKALDGTNISPSSNNVYQGATLRNYAQKVLETDNHTIYSCVAYASNFIQPQLYMVTKDNRFVAKYATPRVLTGITTSEYSIVVGQKSVSLSRDSGYMNPEFIVYTPTLDSKQELTGMQVTTTNFALSTYIYNHRIFKLNDTQFLLMYQGVSGSTTQYLSVCTVNANNTISFGTRYSVPFEIPSSSPLMQNLSLVDFGSGRYIMSHGGGFSQPETRKFLFGFKISDTAISIGPNHTSYLDFYEAEVFKLKDDKVAIFGRKTSDLVAGSSIATINWDTLNITIKNEDNYDFNNIFFENVKSPTSKSVTFNSNKNISSVSRGDFMNVKNNTVFCALFSVSHISSSTTYSKRIIISLFYNDITNSFNIKSILEDVQFDPTSTNNYCKLIKINEDKVLLAKDDNGLRVSSITFENDGKILNHSIQFRKSSTGVSSKMLFNAINRENDGKAFNGDVLIPTSTHDTTAFGAVCIEDFNIGYPLGILQDNNKVVLSGVSKKHIGLSPGIYYYVKLDTGDVVRGIPTELSDSANTSYPLLTINGSYGKEKSPYANTIPIGYAIDSSSLLINNFK